MTTKEEVDAALAGPDPEEDLHPDEVIGNGVEEPKEEANLGSIAGLPIQPVSETIDTINVLIYAESGTGKTVCAGSSVMVPEMAPALLIDIEGGTMSLEQFYPQVEVVRVHSWKQLQKVYDQIEAGKTKYKTLIVDSLTEAQKFSMREIMEAARRDDPTIDPDVPRMRDWGKNINQVRTFVRALRDLPINVIFTALAEVDRDQSGKQTTRPSFNGKVGGEIPGFMDMVLYMYIKERAGHQSRLLLSKRTSDHLAKDRSNRLPAVIENPTMELIYGYATGKLETPPPEEPKPKKAKATK